MGLQQELGLQNPFKDIRHEAVLNVVRTATLLSHRAASLFRRSGLTEAQFNVLFSLKFSEGEVTQVQLGKRLVVTRASITSVLDKLEEKGLVARHKVAENRRIHHVALTPKGLALVNEVEPSYREAIHAVLSDLTINDCKHIIELLEKTRARLR